MDRIIDSNNEIVFENKPEIIRRLPFKSSTYNILNKGMYEAANASYGTASKYFADLTV